MADIVKIVGIYQSQKIDEGKEVKNEALRGLQQTRAANSCLVMFIMRMFIEYE